jgi:transcriptional regulator with XRE-family HTH domain
MKDPSWLFAQRLRLLRDEAGISQEKLAEMADLHRNTIGLVERGKQKPTLDLIVKVAHALKLKPYELIKHIP